MGLSPTGRASKLWQPCQDKQARTSKSSRDVCCTSHLVSETLCQQQEPATRMLRQSLVFRWFARFKSLYELVCPSRVAIGGKKSACQTPGFRAIMGDCATHCDERRQIMEGRVFHSAPASIQCTRASPARAGRREERQDSPCPG